MGKQAFVWKRGRAEKSQRKCKKPREEQSKDKQQRRKLNRALATAEGWGSALPSVLHLLLPECCWGFPSWSRVLNKKVKPLDKNKIYTHI